MELLFESRINLSEFTGRLLFVQHQPTVHPNPVITPDRFEDRHGTLIYGSVLKEDDRFRIWYQTIPEDWDFECEIATVAYAESKDGFEWHKPTLGPGKTPGKGSNLCGLKMHCPSLFRDENAPASHRYRAVGYVNDRLYDAPPGIAGDGYYTAHSADGLSWTLDSAYPRWESADVITSVYHPWQERAIIAMKYSARVQRIDRRCIHTAEYRHGEWSEPVSALYPEEYDDIAAMARGYASCDYYGMGMLPSGSGTVGFLWNFWHNLPYVGKHGCALYGKSDVTLVYQAERGGKWFHMPGRPSFIDHHSAPFISGWVYTAANTVRKGDEELLYISGMPFPHGYNLNPSWKRDDQWAAHLSKHRERVIGVASWPVGRLFGVEAIPDGSLAIDLGKLTSPVRLFLNYKSGYGGGVKVAVIGNETFNTESAIPLEGDEIAGRVRWKCGDLIPPNPTGNTRVELHLVFATVYAYEIQPVDVEAA
jgi:hypothetical protein